MTWTHPGYKRLHDDRVADLTWLAESGEGAHTAALRIGMRYKSLEEWCRRHNRPLWHKLRANEATEWTGLRSGIDHSGRRAS